MLKKIVVITLACSSGIAFSDIMGASCTPKNATVPCTSSGWGVGAQALYLAPSYSNTLAYIGDNSQENSAAFIANDPAWSWGFKLEALYKFNTGNDLNLNWSHLANHHTRTSAFNQIDLIERGGLPTDTVSITPRWDAVNLELGQPVDFNPITSVRFHGGIQYANIQTKKAEFNVATDLDHSILRDETLSFSGLGPRAGLDLAHNFSNGFSLYVQSAAALLIGRNKYNGVVEGIDGGGAIPHEVFRVLSSRASKRIVTPEFESKLGLNYSYSMPQGNLLLDLGYMWVNYFDTQTLGAPGDFVNTRQLLNNSNFALQGPYAGFKWTSSAV